MCEREKSCLFSVQHLPHTTCLLVRNAWNPGWWYQAWAFHFGPPWFCCLAVYSVIEDDVTPLGGLKSCGAFSWKRALLQVLCFLGCTLGAEQPSWTEANTHTQQLIFVCISLSSPPFPVDCCREMVYTLIFAEQKNSHTPNCLYSGVVQSLQIKCSTIKLMLFTARDFYHIKHLFTPKLLICSQFKVSNISSVFCICAVGSFQHGTGRQAGRRYRLLDTCFTLTVLMVVFS